MYTITNNYPTAGYISWANMHMQYNGVTYDIADGYTNYIYIYWLASNPNTFIVSDTFPTLTEDDALVLLNKEGIAMVVPTATVLDGGLIVPHSIYADAIAANTITASELASECISTRHLATGSVTANAIAADAIGAGAIAANVITGDNIVAGSISADEIKPHSITANEIVVGTITADSGILADACITTAKIGDGQITSAKIGELSANNIKAGTLKSINENIKFMLDEGRFIIGEHELKIETDGSLSFTSEVPSDVYDYQFKKATTDKCDAEIDGTFHTTGAFSWGDCKAERRDDEDNAGANSGIDFVF